LAAIHPSSIVAMLHVADVPKSIAFYQKLGFEVGNTFTPHGETALAWAWLQSGFASLMLARASGTVIAEQQAVLFYIYFKDIEATRAELSSAGLNPGPMEFPFYAPRGVFRLFDPDGYVLQLMHT